MGVQWGGGGVGGGRVYRSSKLLVMHSSLGECEYVMP